MKNVFISDHPLVQHKMTKLRDKSTDPKKFRELIREIAGLLTYETTRDLFISVELQEKIGLVPILRSGLGMVEGVWELMPSAEVWHIGIFRDEETLKPVEYYNKLPISPSVGLCLILDPMLATGGSAIATIDILKRWGVSRIKFMGIIGAPEGIKAVHQKHPDIPLHLAVIDDHLNDNGFIVPGLGDAGDRQFGTG